MVVTETGPFGNGGYRQIGSLDKSRSLPESYLFQDAVRCHARSQFNGRL